MDKISVDEASSGSTVQEGFDRVEFACVCMSQLCHGPVVTYCIVYHYTKRAMLARLLVNEGPAIYVVYLNRYFVIPP